ncbi:MAG: 7-carboxy-7-deazaguanine synthase QueE [Candidatus Hermodarchaeota archaeon]
MQICEIFDSFQGEGILCGMPSTFIRTGRCNLRCDYCDSKYTWEKEEFRELSIKAILDEALRFSTDYFVITGGEPLLQKDLPELLYELKQRKKHITIETNCTKFFPELCSFVDLWSVAPKLQSSGETYKGSVLQTFNQLQSPVQFKFVIIEPEDWEELLVLLKEQINSTHPVIVQPDGRLPLEEYQKAWKGLVEKILDTPFRQYNIRVIPQLHRLLYGHQRGV